MIIQLPWTDSLCAIQERKKKKKKRFPPSSFRSSGMSQKLKK